MKKFFSLLLISLMCLSFAACESGNQGGNNNNGNANSNEIAITEDQLSGLVEIVELTQTNWKNYFYIEKVAEEDTNEFGEVTRTNTFYPLRVKTDDIFAYAFYNIAEASWSESAVIECNDNVANCPTFFTPIDEGYNIIDEREREIKIDEFGFTRSSCKLVLFNIPEEYWNTDDNGQKYVVYNNEKIFKGKLVFEKDILSSVAI